MASRSHRPAGSRSTPMDWKPEAVFCCAAPNVRGGINLSAVRLGGDVNAWSARGLSARVKSSSTVTRIMAGRRLWPCGGPPLSARPACSAPASVATSIAPRRHCRSRGLCAAAQPYHHRRRILSATERIHRGHADLTAATIGAIDDEQTSWPKTGDLLLNRCQYGAFIGGPADAESRLDWLSRQTPDRWKADFWPQPYEQLSMVLREMGHDEVMPAPS